MQNEARITVLIPTPLRRFTAGEAKVVVGGSSVAEVLDALEAAHPGIGERLRDDSGQLRRFVNVFVNGQNVRDGRGVDTPSRLATKSASFQRWPEARRLKAGASATAEAEVFRLPEQMRAAIIDHAKRDAPRECCGIIAGRAGVPMQLYETRNVAAGNRFYEIDPAQLIDLEFREFPAQGWSSLPSTTPTLSHLLIHRLPTSNSLSGRMPCF